MEIIKSILLTAIIGICFTFTINTANAAIVNGDLIKTSNNPDVYIVKIFSWSGQKFKRLILNPDIFNQYGHLKWENIKTVSQTEMNSFVISDLVGLGHGEIYKLYPNGDAGTKRLLSMTGEEFKANGYDFSSVYNVNNYELNSYISGSSILPVHRIVGKTSNDEIKTNSETTDSSLNLYDYLQKSKQETRERLKEGGLFSPLEIERMVSQESELIINNWDTISGNYSGSSYAEDYSSLSEQVNLITGVTGLSNGYSNNIGGTTYYHFKDGNTGNSSKIGDTTYYHFSDGTSGKSYNIGDTLYYNFGDTKGTAYNIGSTTYYSGDLIGSSYDIGGTTYYNFNDGTSGRSYNIGGTTYYNYY